MNDKLSPESRLDISKITIKEWWGSLTPAQLWKISGSLVATIALLASTAFTAGYWAGERLTRNVSPLPQEYEWQWPGENWYGRLSLSSDGEKGAVKMARVFKLTKEYTDPKSTHFTFGKLPIIELVSGTFSSDSSELTISLLVNKATEDYPRYVGHSINGKLNSVMRFAGEIEYTNPVTKEHSKGDMILVNYKSLPEEIMQGEFDPYRVFDIQ